MLNVQADLRKRLADALSPIDVYVNVPSKRPETFVEVRREGGAIQNPLLDRPGVGIYAWAPTEAEACNLAEQVRAAIFALPFTGGYAFVEEDSVRSDPDPDSRTPRWYLSYTLTTYEPKGA